MVLSFPVLPGMGVPTLSGVPVLHMQFHKILWEIEKVAVITQLLLRYIIIVLFLLVINPLLCCTLNYIIGRYIQEKQYTHG